MKSVLSYLKLAIPITIVGLVCSSTTYGSTQTLENKALIEYKIDV